MHICSLEYGLVTNPESFTPVGGALLTVLTGGRLKELIEKENALQKMKTKKANFCIITIPYNRCNFYK